MLCAPKLKSFSGNICEFLSVTKQTKKNAIFGIWRRVVLARSELLVIANVVSCLVIHPTLMMDGIGSSGTLVLTGVARNYIPEDRILHSHPRENLISYIAFTGCTLWRRRNVFHVSYELGSYIPEDGILHSHHREDLKCYIALTGWFL
jgi:hypothetical protein